MRPTRTAALAAGMLLALGAASGYAHAQPEPPPPPPATEPPPAPKTAIDADGTYAVGTDIVPGNYSSAGPLPDGACYWKRTNADTVVDNALTKKPQVIQLQAGEAFTTNDCQPWQLTDAPLPPPPGPQQLLGQLGSFLGPAILRGGPPG